MRQGQADRWIDKILDQSSPVRPSHPQEMELARLLVRVCYENRTLSPERVGVLLASAFDLLVAAQYYGAISHAGWLYCPTGTPRLYFHYTNCCPRDVLRDEFHFHPCNKPESGRIGTATSRLLLLFYKAIFEHHGRRVSVLRGSEPVDAVVVDHEKRKVLFAEIKASPLVTPALSGESQRLTIEKDGEAVGRQHSPVDNTALFGFPLQILIPRKKTGSGWGEGYYTIGNRRDKEDWAWGYRGLCKLLTEDANFLSTYFTFWREALASYHPKVTRSVFWLTNACGTPTPLPESWPQRRRGEGFESVSDSKTSVGMDRTDDIKKGIYQVLKLGSVGKPGAAKWEYKTGLISNIHAARHFDEYLESIKDIVWTIDVTGKATKTSDLPEGQHLYNLFDGIVALTHTFARNEWIESLFTL